MNGTHCVYKCKMVNILRQKPMEQATQFSGSIIISSLVGFVLVLLKTHPNAKNEI